MFIFSEHLRPIVASSLMLCLLCLIYADHASCAQVSAEGTRSIYLDNTGIIWEWGDGKWTPCPFLANAKAVQSSPFSTLALRKNGEVWIWGSSKWEKSGQLKNARKYLPPHKILDNTIYSRHLKTHNMLILLDFHAYIYKMFQSITRSYGAKADRNRGNDAAQDFKATTRALVQA